MTEQEYRALEIDVAKAMGYQVKPYNLAHTLWTVVAPNGAYWMRPCDMRPTEERVWQEAMPRFCTDPAATAEVVRYLHRRGWCYELSSGVPHCIPERAVLRVMDVRRHGGKIKCLGIGAEKFIDHNGDPVTAAAVSLCRAVIAAVEAIEATKTTSDQERKGNADATSSHP